MYLKPLFARTDRAVEPYSLSRDSEEYFLFSPVQLRSLHNASSGGESVKRVFCYFHSEMSDACYVNMTVKFHLRLHLRLRRR